MTFIETTKRVALGLALLAAGPAAAADNLAPAIEQVGGEPAPGSGRFEVTVGVRTSLFKGAGFDPFSSSDAFSQTSARASWAVLQRARWATAVGALFEWGDASADARGAQAQLSLTRFGVLLEERLALGPHARVVGRLAPAWLTGRATLDDPSLPVALGRSFSTIAVDASAGVEARLNAPGSTVGVWAVGEGGYGWAPTQTMTFTPQLAVADRDKAGATTLPDFAPRGGFFRLGLALTY
ncbi:MAG TPA: hypothetical protein VHJ20_18560 [Polyangia bacterium]|nr:hypothetical protein [Polyangia bacterium]